MVSVAALMRVVGIDPFPLLPPSVKHVAMLLPAKKNATLRVGAVDPARPLRWREPATHLGSP